MPDSRRPLDATAVGAMIALSMLWGFQQVAIKLTAPDISLVMQAGLRSVIAGLPSHSSSFDQRRRPDTLRTAMATAFFWPTRTTNCFPLVTPV